ncbi:MAG: peptide deformylase [Oscillospiraceae bacterium]|nr:peptide deformylase [Oscillospiraceae bacterium]MDY2848624.1 peptide deformylase [Oscillospiraceae bacterium]
MAIRNIVKKGDEVLRKKCRPVTKFDDRLFQLLDDMKDTLVKADGCGLAAPQVGVLRRIVIIDVGDGPIELINPEIVKMSGRQREVEGCLSCPNEWGYVKRPMKVTVRALNRNGDTVEYCGKELFARAVCHELDHLDGRLFVDIADEMVDPSEMEDRK